MPRRRRISPQPRAPISATMRACAWRHKRWARAKRARPAGVSSMRFTRRSGCEARRISPSFSSTFSARASVVWSASIAASSAAALTGASRRMPSSRPYCVALSPLGRIASS
jgi:hypothetical protein